MNFTYNSYFLKYVYVCTVVLQVSSYHSKSHCGFTWQHTFQEGLEKWQELHSAQLQYMIQLLGLQCSVNGGNK